MVTTKKIVFIDDDPNWVFIIPHLAGLLGFPIISAQNTHNCLEIIQNDDNVSLLLTDIRMPTGSGFDLIAQVRSIKPQMPVVIVTGYQTEKLNEFINLNRVEGLLIKPFSIGEFDQNIRKALDLVN